MKHSIVRWGLVFSLLLTLVTVSAGADSTTTPPPPDNPHFNKSASAYTTHDSTWQPLTAPTGNVTLAAGHYYLTDNISIESGSSSTRWMIAENATVTICLNGKTLEKANKTTTTANGGGIIFQFQKANATLNICDCQKNSAGGSGSISCGIDKEHSSTKSHITCRVVYAGAKNTTVNLFDGIKIKDSTTDNLFTLNAGSDWTTNHGTTLNIVDAQITNNIFTSSSGLIKTSGYSTVNMWSPSTISDNRSGHASGSGTVYLTGAGLDNNSGSIFNMYGGTISGNRVSKGGAVAMVNHGTFNLHDGTIGATEEGAGNTATYGGAVYMQRLFNKTSVIYFPSFVMNGGEIKGNSATSGGAVYIDNGSSEIVGSDTAKGEDFHAFTMLGGTISDNTASGNGGAVYVETSGSFKVSGTSAAITDNTAKGGNGGAIYTLGKVTMAGGSITGNSATVANEVGGYGGGLYVDVLVNAAEANKSGTGSVTISNGAITGNSGTAACGGIYALGTVTVNGGTIKSNTGVYTGNGCDVRAQGDANVTFNGGTVGTPGTENCVVVMTDTVGMTPIMTFNDGIFGGINVSRGSAVTLENYATSAATAQFNGGIFDRKYTADSDAAKDAIVRTIGAGKMFLPYDNSKYIVTSHAYEGSNMRIHEALDLVFNFTAEDVATATKAMVYKPGFDPFEADVVLDPETGFQTVTIDVAAKEMTKEIKVILKDVNGEYVTSYADSVRQYGLRMLADEDQSDYYGLIVDMLNYGAAAQQYLAEPDEEGNITTGTLANAGLTEEQKLLATDVSDRIEEANVDQLYRTNSRAYHSANLTLDSQVDFNLYFRVDQIGDSVAYEYTIGDKKVSDKEFSEYLDTTSEEDEKPVLYRVKIADLTVADLANAEVKVTFKDKDGEKTITDSVFNYLLRNNNKSKWAQDGTGDYDLSKSLMAFAVSASQCASGNPVIGANGLPIM